ncbi:MAG: 1,4-dihydroxy-2-naphthoate octaprenyltransferase [Anaerolineae bacterium]
MSEQHSNKEILSVLQSVEVVAVATSAGDRMRNRMMHYAVDEDFTIYLATMKDDPKTIQITNCPSIALLIHEQGSEGDINDSQEVEIIGKAIIIRDERERQKALEATALRSPVVKHLVEAGNAGVLDCIKVAPQTVKFRVFREIIQGQPPTVIEFPENRAVISDWELLKMKAKSWVLGLRLSFLTASIIPIFLGAAIAWAHKGALDWGYFLLTLIAGLALHAGTNLINDYFDHLSGNDEMNREFVRPFSGGSRVIQLGLLTPLEVLMGSLLFFTLGSLTGLYLVWTRGLFILVLGAVALLSGVFYTRRPFNGASQGIGEAVVGLNFGILMVLGAYYVQVQDFSWAPVVAGIPLSLLIAAVLYVNEFPDYVADKAVGKRTLVVRLGRKRAVVGYIVLLGATYFAILAGVIGGVLPLAALLGLSTLPASLRAIQYARKHYASSFDLVPANGLTVVTHLATGLLLTLAYAWEGLGLQGIGYVAALGVGFAGFIIYMYWYVERQKDIFLGLRQAMR